MFSEIMRTYVAGILSPTFLILGLFCFSLWCLKKEKFSWAKKSLATGLILFVFFTSGIIRHTLYSFIETAPLTVPSDYKYVVVLGARIYPSQNQPVSAQLSDTLLSRLSYGVELWRKNPESTIVVTGNGAGKIPEAHIMGLYLESMGVPKDKIIVEDKSMNTKDHPVYLKPILNNDKFLIVTSAYHMKRSLQNFEAHSLHGFAAATDYVNTDHLGLTHLMLRSENLALNDRWFSEIYSTIWTKIRLFLKG